MVSGLLFVLRWTAIIIEVGWLGPSGGKVQTIIILIPMLVLFAGIVGLIPEDLFIVAYLFTIVGVVGYIAASFIYPLFTIAGKPMLAVSFYKNMSETEWAFGRIAETEGGLLFRECPGGNKSLICAEIQSVPFLNTRVPFRMVVLKFPEGVDPSSLFDNDYVEPNSGFGRIPVRIAYLSGVQIGEWVLSQKTAFKTWRDRLLEWFGRRVERIERVPIIYVTRYKLRKVKVLEKAVSVLKRSLRGGEVSGERAPIILVTGYRAADLRVLSKVSQELKKIAGYQEVKGSAKAWVSEIGQVRVISTELEELRADNMKLRQIIRGLERIYQSPPSITTAPIEIEEGSSSRYEAVKNIGIGVGIAVLAFLVLIILGVI